MAKESNGHLCLARFDVRISDTISLRSLFPRPPIEGDGRATPWGSGSAAVISNAGYNGIAVAGASDLG